jgi:hypothetical protein
VRAVIGRLSALGAILAVAAGVCAGHAAAEPADPGPTPAPVPSPVPAPATPAPAELLGAIGRVLSQAGNPAAGPLGMPDLSAYGTNLLLGQTALPSLPGAPAATVPDLRAFDTDYLLPQNTAPAAPGAGSPAPGIGPNDDIGGTGRIAFLRRLHEMYQSGGLQGALLGQQSPEEFAADHAAQQSVIGPQPAPPG